MRRIVTLIFLLSLILSSCGTYRSDGSSSSGETYIPDTESASEEKTTLSGFGIAGESAGSTPAETTAEEPVTEETSAEATTETPAAEEPTTEEQLQAVENIYLDAGWTYAEESRINDGYAVLYRAQKDRKNIVVGVNAGHGTRGGDSVKTYCHPDHTPKVTGGTTAEGAVKSVAVSSGMDFDDGTPESEVTLKTAKLLCEYLLEEGYDVLMLRDGDDARLDNVARTVISNNIANCHIALHWDGDGLGYDKGAYFMSVPDELKRMYPVSDNWEQHERLGNSLIEGLKEEDRKIWDGGSQDMDLTQTSYSTVPSVDIELGNQSSSHDDETLSKIARGLCRGVEEFFEQR